MQYQEQVKIHKFGDIIWKNKKIWSVLRHRVSTGTHHGIETNPFRLENKRAPGDVHRRRRNIEAEIRSTARVCY